jgi:hypothetical protein
MDVPDATRIRAKLAAGKTSKPWPDSRIDPLAARATIIVRPLGRARRFFASGGASERDRFLAGAQRRGEIALVAAVIGDVSDSGSHHPLSQYHSSVNLSDMHTNLNGRARARGNPGRARAGA